MKKIFLIVIFYSCCIHSIVLCQGIKNIWHLGYNSGVLPKCYMDFSNGSPVSTAINRPMNFGPTCTSICNNSGNLLFYTNGVYVANALHDTMANGSNLSPSAFTTSWAHDGLPIFAGVLALPWPDSINKYLLIHETLNFDANINYRPKQILYSVIDMNLDSGLGEVIQKNSILINDTLEGGMLTACKHANGRDWWILIKKYVSDKYFRILFTPVGITGIDTISVGGPTSMFGGQASFSPDGNWFVTYDNLSKIRIYNFDRCNGDLINYIYYPIADPYIGGGVSFSSNSSKLYLSNSKYLYQFDLTVSNIVNSQTLIGEFDSTYFSPYPPYQTNFWYHMLGPDGKIYINSQASVVDLHVIENPDNFGLSCNLQQHSFYLGGFNISTLPNHVNYYLGCDTASTCACLVSGIQNNQSNDFKFALFPNPNNGKFHINYQLPDNEEGNIEIFDVTGKLLYELFLPQWSTLQQIRLPNLTAGIYNIILNSNNQRITKKFIVMND